jgi:coenzyme F420 hydrogenase subunit beta
MMDMTSAPPSDLSHGQPPLVPEFAEPAPRGMCTDCGVSRMSDPKACGVACQFIQPDYEAAERRVHGRARDASRPGELHFGTHIAMHRAALKSPADGAQWTGITTRIAERLLETGRVSAVLTMIPDEADRWKPVPAIITKPGDMAKARGMRMGFAPLLALLEPARAAGHRSIAVIGIPCQIHALRSLEARLGFDDILVIGTPCSDNTHTAMFHRFLAEIDSTPDDITYLEFRADYRVEVRYRDGVTRLIPFLQLPLSRLPADFFPLTCRTCVDYVNSLADITVGYMGGQGRQWLIVRNKRGAELLTLLGDEVVLEQPGSGGNRKSAVKGFAANVRRAAGGLPLRAMPDWLRPLMGWLMPRIGPKGMEFARARVEMKAVETILHLAREEPAKAKNMIPPHVHALAAQYLEAGDTAG